MKIFQFLDYVEFIQAKVKSLPNGGRGELLRIAKAAHLQPSTLSQVLQRNRDLTQEQAASIASYYSLTDGETQYFILLVHHQRAGTESLKRILRKQIEEIRTRESQLVKRLPFEQALTDEQKAIFYSNWFYSGIRVLSSVPDAQTAESLAAKLKLPRNLVAQVIEFLVAHHLCIERDGRVQPVSQSTHLEAGSPIVARHHGNWRVKAMEKHPLLSRAKELAYTSPMSLSRADAIKIKEKITTFIEEVCATVDPSPPEAAYCLNIDWFEY